MPDVAVSADDVRVVSDVLTLASRAFGSHLGAIPGFGAALEACGRMSVAAERSELPEDPISNSKSLAIAFNEMMRDYMEADFDRTEAFRLTEIQASAIAQIGLARTLHG